jgi:hypothetical protein
VASHNLIVHEMEAGRTNRSDHKGVNGVNERNGSEPTAPLQLTSS